MTTSRNAESVKSLTNPMLGREQPLGDLMRMAHRRLVNYLNAGLVDSAYTNLTSAHVSVMATVDADGSRLMTLASRGGRTKQAAAELAGHLVARGYLRLLPDPTDGRAKLYVLTAQGTALLDSCGAVVDRYEQWLDALLGRETVAQLRRSLRIISEHAQDDVSFGAGSAASR